MAFRSVRLIQMNTKCSSTGIIVVGDIASYFLLTYTKYYYIFRLKSDVIKSIPDYQNFIYSPTDAVVSCLKKQY